MNLLGQKCKDSITGFEGIATARHQYLYGCIRYTLENKKGLSETFDEQRLNSKSKIDIGGPMPLPKPRHLPTR